MTPRDTFAMMGLLSEVEAICGAKGVTLEEATGRSRLRSITSARHAIWLLLRQTGLSLPAVGRITGHDHTSVLHGLRRLDRRVAEENAARHARLDAQFLRITQAREAARAI